MNTIQVSGKVTQTFSYCGGAAPPPEMLAKLATPVPYPGKKFYIRRGVINKHNSLVISNFISNTDGEFSLQLAPGTYSIILEAQVKQTPLSAYKKDNLQVDEKCLQQWWKQPYYILKVEDKDIVDLNFNFHHRCFIDNDIPCISYTGPSPP